MEDAEFVGVVRPHFNLLGEVNEVGDIPNQPAVAVDSEMHCACFIDDGWGIGEMRDGVWRLHFARVPCGDFLKHCVVIANLQPHPGIGQILRVRTNWRSKKPGSVSKEQVRASHRTFLFFNLPGMVNGTLTSGLSHKMHYEKRLCIQMTHLHTMINI